MALSDLDILEQLKSGNDSVLEELYARNMGFVVNYVKMNNGSEDDAKDIFQDAIFKFWENVMIGRFELKSSISTYIIAIAKNKWLQRITRKKDVHLTKEMEDALENYLINEDEPDNEEALKKAMKCLDELSESARQVVEYYYFNKISTKEIALKMGLKNEETVKTRKYKIMQMLENCIQTK